ncbi:hypothetical protein L596_015444 [Steinernema carpocapsae]|uniref:Uncharacterized protein n=1 Tax=Steinernema carpocapsae TaxID=34508 RepID=A0A4U5NF64_STECR|nr:hypothetical protein L596_015444 [Steinernema carpocapsae]
MKLSTLLILCLSLSVALAAVEFDSLKGAKPKRPFRVMKRKPSGAKQFWKRSAVVDEPKRQRQKRDDYYYYSYYYHYD